MRPSIVHSVAFALAALAGHALSLPVRDQPYIPKLGIVPSENDDTERIGSPRPTYKELSSPRPVLGGSSSPRPVPGGSTPRPSVLQRVASWTNRTPRPYSPLSEEPSDLLECPETDRAHQAWNDELIRQGHVFTEFTEAYTFTKYCLYTATLVNISSKRKQFVVAMARRVPSTEDLDSTIDPSQNFGTQLLQGVTKVAERSWELYKPDSALGVRFYELAAWGEIRRANGSQAKKRLRKQFENQIQESILKAQRDNNIKTNQDNINKMLFVDNGPGELFSVQFVELDKTQVPQGSSSAGEDKDMLRSIMRTIGNKLSG